MSNYTITPSHHKVKRIDIWLIKPREKLDYTTYKQVESKIKVIGGYYSKFTHSFVFEKEPLESQLDEIFGGVVGQNSQAELSGVSANKMAAIRLNDKDAVVDKRTLRSEYNAGKLLVARTQFFDGMIDSTRTIPEAERVWSDKDKDFEREFDYSARPYIYNGGVRFGDFNAKYKEGITIPEPMAKVNNQTSLNFYVILDNNKSDQETFQLERDDSKNDDIEKGVRVIAQYYGKRFFGTVTDKEVNFYTISSWMPGSGTKSNETRKSVYYTVTLDNGTVHKMSNFQLDEKNEYLKHPVIAAIKDDGDFKMPESFWTFDIIRSINYINSMKRQMAGRKKQEYKNQDQKNINISENSLMSNMTTWIAWEEANLDYARTITNETPTEQNKRIVAWREQYHVKPIGKNDYSPKSMAKNNNALLQKLAKLNQLI